METIRNPLEWTADQLRQFGQALDTTGGALRGAPTSRAAAPPAVRRITPADLREALAKGLEDFAACRTDVLFLCLFYPLAGLILAHLVFHYDLLPLLFPLASGFVLIGPVAGIGLYEMSRRRELGLRVGWSDAFGVLGSRSFGAIVVLSLLLLAIFFLWLAVAQGIYLLLFGFEQPASVAAFLDKVFTTGPGWTLMVVGVGVGFLFALTVLTLSVVSFPLLLDRDVGLRVAIATSVRAVARNPVVMAAWGLIVAGGLLLGALPLFLGLVVVLPVLGHATWHLYRKVVVT